MNTKKSEWMDVISAGLDTIERLVKTEIRGLLLSQIIDNCIASTDDFSSKVWLASMGIALQNGIKEIVELKSELNDFVNGLCELAYANSKRK